MGRAQDKVVFVTGAFPARQATPIPYIEPVGIGSSLKFHDFHP